VPLDKAAFFVVIKTAFGCRLPTVIVGKAAQRIYSRTERRNNCIPVLCGLLHKSFHFKFTHYWSYLSWQILQLWLNAKLKGKAL
jgi:hypothetical protein